MGITTRWFKSLFGIKPSSSSNRDNKDRWTWCGGFGHSEGRDASDRADNSPPESDWLKSYYYAQSDKEQSKHAIAVAAATAAAADAAVAAAHAAVAVVRLTSHGRGSTMFSGHERSAAVKIQAVFRGYLARKALRALKGLVKLQAHVRGYLVRKQADETLHSMQALIRAQSAARSHRAFRRNRLGNRARKSTDKFDEIRRDNYYHSTASFHHSRRLSVSIDAGSTLDDTPKIVEMDTGSRYRSRSLGTTVTNKQSSVTGYDDDPHRPSRNPPPRLSIPDHRNIHDYPPSSDWGLTGDDCRFSTAHSTPRFPTPVVGGRVEPVTPNGEFPSYMTNTQSFRAKLRSYSAPKQRPELAIGTPGRKRVSLNELMECRNSLSGVRMEKSCSRAQEAAIDFKIAGMGKLDGSLNFGTVREILELERR